jgi:hypothetical protein
MMEAQVVLATIAQRYRLHLAAGQRVEPQGRDNDPSPLWFTDDAATARAEVNGSSRGEEVAARSW